jgi:hypothetical protein
MVLQRFRLFGAPRGCRSLAAITALVLFLVLCALGAGLVAYRTLAPLNQTAGASAPSSDPPSAVSASPTPVPGYHPQPEDELDSVAMVSSREGWAVGSAYVSGQVYAPLILHYTGSRWERIPDPSNTALQARTAGLQQVSMVSTSEGWAVGSLERETPQPDGSTDAAFILHYQHGSWRLQGTFGGALHSLWMLSSTDGWAVGSIGTEIGQSLVLHYDGHTWTSVDAPGAGLASLVMTTPTNGWAFGFSAGRYAGQFSGLLLHYTGSAWRPVKLPFIDTFFALAMAATGEGWLVGTQSQTTAAPPIFAHEHAGSWTAVQTPVTANPNASITSLALASASEGWAVGTLQASGSSAGTGASTLYLHWHNGQWTKVAGPDAGSVNSLALVSASEGWGVGNGGVILHEQQGVWSLVTGLPSL